MASAMTLATALYSLGYKAVICNNVLLSTMYVVQIYLTVLCVCMQGEDIRAIRTLIRYEPCTAVVFGLFTENTQRALEDKAGAGDGVQKSCNLQDEGCCLYRLIRVRL